MKRKLGKLICRIAGSHDEFIIQQPRSGTHTYCTRCDFDYQKAGS